MQLAKIQIRDPFVLPLPESGIYYLFGTTSKNCWSGPEEGFDCYRSRDLLEWEGPMAAFRPPVDFWSDRNFWAPEVHRYHGRYYMFATFFAENKYRGTQILSADQPQGPFAPWSDGPVTPQNWMCLDGTLHVDSEGNPWIVFCHEWTQIHNGAICAMRLANDLRQSTGRPVFLFNASESPWVHVHKPHDMTCRYPVYVTDGPFLYRTSKGVLLMLWSSFGSTGYAMGIARSQSGTVQGPWTQDPQPIWAKDGGHGMIFRAFDGRLFLTLHQPNDTPNERAVFREVIDDGKSIALKPT